MKFNKQMAMLGLGIIASTNVLAQTFYQCMPCPAGSYASGGKCVSCPTTGFSKCNNTDQKREYCHSYATEKDCNNSYGCKSENGPIGYIVNDTKTGCIKCPAGTGLDITKSTCIPCASGTYSNVGICIPCPVGTYQDSSGQSRCVSCPDGYYQNKEGQTSCIKNPISRVVVGFGVPNSPTTAYKSLNLYTDYECSSDTFGRDPAHGVEKVCRLKNNEGYSTDEGYYFSVVINKATGAPRLGGGFGLLSSPCASALVSYAWSNHQNIPYIPTGNVDYASGGRFYTYLFEEGTHNCSNSFFGDPDSGYKKACFAGGRKIASENTKFTVRCDPSTGYMTVSGDLGSAKVKY